MPGAAQHLMGMGGELARAGLLPACFRGTLLCLFLLLFVFSSCPFLKTVYFFLFSLFLSKDRTWVLQAGTSYAALVPKQVLTLNTACFAPFPTPRTEQTASYLASREASAGAGS